MIFETLQYIDNIEINGSGGGTRTPDTRIMMISLIKEIFNYSYLLSKLAGVLKSALNYDTRTITFTLFNTTIMPLINSERK